MLGYDAVFISFPVAEHVLSHMPDGNPTAITILMHKTSCY